YIDLIYVVMRIFSVEMEGNDGTYIEECEDIVGVYSDKKDIEKYQNIVEVSVGKKDIAEAPPDKKDIVDVSSDKKDIVEVSSDKKDIVDASSDKKDIVNTSVGKKDIIDFSNKKNIENYEIETYILEKE